MWQSQRTASVTAAVVDVLVDGVADWTAVVPETVWHMNWFHCVDPTGKLDVDKTRLGMYPGRSPPSQKFTVLAEPLVMVTVVESGPPARQARDAIRSPGRSRPRDR